MFFKYIISVFLIITILFSSVFAAGDDFSGGGGVMDPPSGNASGGGGTTSGGGSGRVDFPTYVREFSLLEELNYQISKWITDLFSSNPDATNEEILEAYDNYVESIEADLGTTTLNSNGSLRYYFIPIAAGIRDNSNRYGTLVRYNFGNNSDFVVSVYRHNSWGSISNNGYLTVTYRTFIVPTDGYITCHLIESYSVSYSGFQFSGFFSDHNANHHVTTTNHFLSDNKVNISCKLCDGDTFTCGASVYSSDGSIPSNPPPIFKYYNTAWLDFEPDLSSDFYQSINIDLSNSSRAAAIVGDYAYLDQSNNNYVVSHDRIINEDNSTIYNPVTNNYTEFTDYTYNYDNRSYTFNTGDTITYGDEHITYITNEGDTYNFYYYVQPSEPTPSPGPVPTPDPHNWVMDSHTEPTCTEPGITTYHCSDCGETKTEYLDALGHDWIETESQPDTYSLPPDTACPVCSNTDLDTTLVTDQYHCTCHNCQREFVVTANVVYGYKKYVCSRCGMEMTEDNSYSSGLWSTIGDFLAHSVEWVVEKLRLLAESLSGLTDAMDDASDDILDATEDYPEFITEAVGSFPAEFMRIIWAVLIIVVVVLVFCKIIK